MKSATLASRRDIICKIFLVVSLLTHQVPREVQKDGIIKQVSETIAKSRLEDKTFIDNFVTQVDHQEINVTTKVKFRSFILVIF